MTQGIYRILNLKTGRAYIGSSMHVETRWREHRRCLRHDIHRNKRLQRDWQRYGGRVFGISVLEIVDNADDLLNREQYWFDILQPFGKDGYNVGRQAAAPARGRVVTEAECRRSSKLHKGNKYNLGRKHGPRPLAWRQKHALAIRGSKNGFTRLTETEVLEIKGLLAQYDAMSRPRPRGHALSLYKIAERYGVSKGVIDGIHNGRAWGWLTNESVAS